VLSFVGRTTTHSPAMTSGSWAGVIWVTRVADVTSTVAGPRAPVNETVPPETEPTSPYALSLPPPLPEAPGVGLAELVDEEVVDVALLLDVGDDGVLDEPQAARDSAVQLASATAAQRETRDEMTMNSPSVSGLSPRFDDHVKSLWKPARRELA
jgi:hypothetical protein